MRTGSRFLVCGLLVFSVLVSGLIPLSSVKASSPLSFAIAPSSQESSPEGEDYLILLPYEAPQPQEIPFTFKPGQKQIVLADLIYQRTKTLRAELEQLRAQGLIAGFEVRPDLYGLVVHGLTQDGMRRLQNLPDVGGVLPKDSQNQTCAVATATAFIHQVEALGQSLERREALESKGGFEAMATNPSITVIYYGYSWVYGQTFSNTTVTLRVLRGSTVVVTTTTTSDSMGWYYFNPDWIDCPTSGYTWSLQPGDVVEVSAGGRTARTVVAYISAWADPQTDQVSGKTDPGRQVEIHVYYYPNNPCISVESQKVVTPDSNGNFTASMGVDFDGQAWGEIYVRDANGNSTLRWFEAYHLVADMQNNSVSGVTKPDITFTATLKRGSTTLESYAGTSDPDDGSLRVYFYNPFQPGDEIHLDGGGIHLQYIIAPLTSVSVDSTANQVSGITSPDRWIQGNFGKSSYYDIVTTCGWSRACASTMSDGGGGFTLPSPMDLVRGDVVDIYVIDAQGNYQYHMLRVPVIGVDISEPTRNRAVGAWTTADRTLTVTHKTSGGSVREAITDVYVSTWSNEFDVYLSNDVAPGDRIEVSDGITSLEMVVPNPLPKASLKNNINRLYLEALNGSHVLVEFWDFRSQNFSYYYYCNEADLSTSSTNLQIDDAQIGGWDTAYTTIRLPSEHIVRIDRNAFMVTHSIGGGWVDITYEPSVTILAEWWRGSTKLWQVSTTLINSWGYMDLPGVPQPGDRLVVKTSDNQQWAEMTVPALTINLDRPNNRIYGKSVPNRPITVQLQRFAARGYYVLNKIVQADAGGNYSASFNGLYWWDCSPARLDHRCASGGLDYFVQGDHAFFLDAPSPISAPADVYEYDNDRSYARAYTTVQTHTFHVEGDEDWVTFTVPPDDVGNVIYRIATVNEGWDVETVITLYDAGGNQILEGYGWWDGIYWIPDTAGTYYVKVSPWSDEFTAHCDAYYDLLILPIRAEVYLPLVRR
ncbi:hypothetical protein [Thermanaerothrix sp.]|jgi:hypothetical protein|uniref:hypothetical protein n=1 Tax=Thermanaerothrix sp. TaxID=2972675 RepID=UPI002ADD3693|nr:hypothetical protein [Thermanaerothrix sp.]